MRLGLALFLTVAALGAGCGSSETSSGPNPGSTNPVPYESDSGQKYDEKGFPIEEDGSVSNDPDDFEESVCALAYFADDPECQ